MTRFRVAAMTLVLALVALAFPSTMKGQNWDKKTTVTFSAPVEIPGVGAQVLPAGKYTFRLLDSASDRHIVQIFNEREDHIFATILAIPNYRLKPTSRTVMTFRERAAGEPQAIRSWFYPGDNFGQEFVYPKMRAIELAKLVDEPVLAMPTELAETITMPIKSADDPAVVTLKQAPIEAVKPTGEVVSMAEVVELPPARTEPVKTMNASDSTKSLPHTASSMPLLGLIGLLSLAAGIALSLVVNRSA
jgi:LPXTG cell wall anchor motif